ncbi:MAG: VOC family protein [Gammaproteobacteria bacterium]|nr:VOC family protein [Gammaproteobacteria bacterium]
MAAVQLESRTRYFQPRRLGHVNLWVKSIPVSEDFYHTRCGLTVEFTEPDLVASFLGTGATPHDLGMIQVTNGVDRYGRNGLLQLPGTIGRDVGLNHLAWELENEAALVEAYRNLKADGIATDITVDHQVAHSVYIFDPDGNYNEYYCDTVKNWQSVLKGPMDLITSHWDPLAETPFTEGRYDEAPEWHVVDSAPLHPRRVTHAVLQTPKLDALRDFYTRISGLRVVTEEEGACFLGGSLSGYPYNLVLVPADKPGYHHVSFELKDEAELEKSLRRLHTAGVKVEGETDLPWKRSLFLRDPDGLLSEWYVRRAAPRTLAARGALSLARAV